MGVLEGLGGRGRVKRPSPDGAGREAGLLELDTEGHMMLGQDGRGLGCPLLIPSLDGPGQAPHQLFCRERKGHHS